jgi:very-short-patch-repair endonuclease
MNEHDIMMEYSTDNVSITALAKKHNTYENKIRRILLKNGVKLRDKSEAQKLALSSGRHSHPTKGKTRTDDEKLKIGTALVKNWELMSKEDYEKRVASARQAWDRMTEEEQRRLRQSASKSIRKSSKDGSKFEHFIKDRLTLEGFQVLFHSEQMVSNFNLQLDMFISDCNTAIEVDGLSHYAPIWGEESLNRTLASDQQKNGLLLNDGMVVIRIKNALKSLSKTKMEVLVKQLVEILKEIQINFPPQNKRLINLEV